MSYGENENLGFQKQHGGLTWDSIRDGRGGKEKKRLRKTPDAKLMNGLDTMQQQAMFYIERGQLAISGSLDVSVAPWARLPGKGVSDHSEWLQALINNFNNWIAECKREHYSPSMARDVICEGMSCREVDRKWTFRDGTASQNLKNCLDVYCKMMGWKR